MATTIDRLIVDTNAVIALIREGQTDPSPIHAAAEILLPLPVVGELLGGVYGSRYVDANMDAFNRTVELWRVLLPDLGTAHAYGRIRGSLRIDRIGGSKLNDLWIAALCLQHDLPLLTNDRGFDAIPGLRVIHW